MISRLVIQLRTDSKEKINYNIGSALQGVMMNVIDTNYAGELHKQGINPYSQYFYRDGKRMYWVINTLTNEARSEIVLPFVEKKCGEFFIKHKSKEFIPSIIGVKDMECDKLVHGKLSSYIDVEFVTPTAFKSKGEYKFIPEVRLILNSLVNKMKIVEEVDEEMVEELMNKVKIVEYQLSSAKFSVEGNKIPAFMGTLTLGLNKCNDREKELVHKLLRFGEYSGIGIKTSMGMGAICVKK